MPWCCIGFVANFICFPAVKKFKNRLRFDKVTESLKVGTFLRQCRKSKFYKQVVSNTLFGLKIFSLGVCEGRITLNVNFGPHSYLENY